MESKNQANTSHAKRCKSHMVDDNSGIRLVDNGSTISIEWPSLPEGQFHDLSDLSNLYLTITPNGQYKMSRKIFST